MFKMLVGAHRHSNRFVASRAFSSEVATTDGAAEPFTGIKTLWQYSAMQE